MKNNYLFRVALGIVLCVQVFAKPAADVPSSSSASSPKGQKQQERLLKSGRKVEDLLLQAKKDLDPSVLEKLNLDDDDSLAQLDQLIGEQQNKRAQYAFNYNIQDEISDSYMERNEERKGLSVTGQYSYSNGYSRNTVEYVADENGYRVTNVESEPIGDGPHPNKFGTAIVQQVVSGVQTNYAIQAQPVEDTGNQTDSTVAASGRAAVTTGKGVVKLVDVTPDFLVKEEEEDSKETPAVTA